MGEYQHTLDTKGRLIVPAKFREALGTGAVLTRGLDNCLFLFPHEEWLALEEKLKSLPLTKAGARQFVRFLFSGATDCELDKQGRIVVPPTPAGVRRNSEGRSCDRSLQSGGDLE